MRLIRVGSTHSFRPLPKFLDGGCGSCVALEARPRLGLAHELPQLAEQLSRWNVLPAEGVDPFEPLQYFRRFVHEPTVAAKPSRVCTRSVPIL